MMDLMGFVIVFLCLVILALGSVGLLLMILDLLGLLEPLKKRIKERVREE